MQERSYWEEILEVCKTQDATKLQELINEKGRPPNFIPEKNSTLLDLVSTSFKTSNSKVSIESKERDQIITTLKKNGGTSAMFLKTPLIAAPTILALGIALASNPGIIIGISHTLGATFAALSIAGIAALAIAPLVAPQILMASLLLSSSGTTLMAGIAASAALLYVVNGDKFPSCAMKMTDNAYQYFHQNVIEALVDAAAQVDQKAQEITQTAREKIESTAQRVADTVKGWVR